jgi:tRNA-2-methylthio-N6-dimethylallyladenosine synthase
MVAKVNRKLRIRFSTSNPQDMSDDVIAIMSQYQNICNYIHLPVQSGSSRILKLMNRGYNREEYISLIDRIKTKIPDCAISMDMITGFCTENDNDHQETISLMRYVKYDYGYMFKYSERPNTAAEKKYNDDVKEEIKQKRLVEIINLQQAQSLENNKKRLNKTYEVLIEGYSKRSKNHYSGRTTHNCVVVFEKGKQKIGDYVNVKIYDCTAGTLKGKII